ncbi:MAG: NAD(P)-dependent oxidoreductase [Gammaproteobacteria bacterium]|nr:NAD(P)-dependent oxidoreductase [Gammaproteobacteria bacterium]
MSKYRVLLDEKLEHHARMLLNDAGIKTDVVRLTTGNLIRLLQANPYDALIVRERVRIPLEVMEAAPLSLKIIGVLGDSPRNVNLMEATACGIVVKITEYGNTFEAANLSKRLMVFLLSDSFQQNKDKKATLLSDPAAPPPKGYSGFELAGKTVGLIGCGRVAQTLALMILPHCTRVLGFDNHPRSVYEEFHLPDPLLRPIIEYCQIEEVVKRADIISIHTSGEEQVFLIDKIFQSRRKPFIINTARDAVFHEEALLSALKKGRIRGAAFTLPLSDLKSGEYPEGIKPFLNLGNVLIAPTQGRPVAEAHKKNVKRLAIAVADFLLKGDMSLAVNPPELFGGPADRHYPYTIRTQRVALRLPL